MEAFIVKNNYSLATLLVEQFEKENIISEVFKLFNVDCIKRCQLNPSVLDGLIKKFNQNNECDISVLEKLFHL